MERRCKNRMLPPAASEDPRCVVHDLPDDLLRLILLRLDSPLWLVRVACACKRWRRVVTGDSGDQGRAFLRLASSLHPPVVVGHYVGNFGGDYRFVPSPPPTPIRLSSFDFFHTGEFVQRHPTIYRWHVLDCHGGLVLLRDGSRRRMSDLGPLSDLVVCDPLSRRYRDIHHPPNQLISIMGSNVPRAFLLDGGGDDDGNISISNFRVMLYNSYDTSLTKVYVFSTADGYWRLVRQSYPSRAAFDHDDDSFVNSYMGVIGRIGRSLYMSSLLGVVRVLDNARLAFSDVDLPIGAWWDSQLEFDKSSTPTFAVVHGTSPDPATLPATAFIVHVQGEALNLLRLIPISGEWVLEHSIPLLSEATRGLPGYPERSQWTAVEVIAGGTRLAVIKVSLTCSTRSRSRSWLFSLDVDTMRSCRWCLALTWPRRRTG